MSRNEAARCEDDHEAQPAILGNNIDWLLAYIVRLESAINDAIRHGRSADHMKVRLRAAMNFEKYHSNACGCGCNADLPAPDAKG